MNLFSTDFPTRFACLNNPGIVWGLNISDWLICAAYTIIPLGFLIMTKRMRSTMSRTFLLTASLFIVFCGWGHVVLSLMSVYPCYRFYLGWNCCTAIVSWIFVVLLLGFIRQINEVVISNDELKRTNDRLVALMDKMKQ